MRADIDAHVAAVLQSRINANASGQAGEDVENIRAAAATVNRYCRAEMCL